MGNFEETLGNWSCKLDEMLTLLGFLGRKLAGSVSRWFPNLCIDRKPGNWKLMKLR
jgi:hypothetical protein